MEGEIPIINGKQTKLPETVTTIVMATIPSTCGWIQCHTYLAIEQ